MPEARKQRPRIDAILNHIKRGAFDEELPRIQTAINARNEVRKAAVEQLVREVYGEGYAVAQRGNPFLADKGKRTRPGSDPSSAGQEAPERLPGEVLPGESPHVLDPNSPEGVAALGADEDDNPDIESRSPLIGGLDSPEPPA